jgi:predicted amidohydrolase YtcJ
MLGTETLRAYEDLARDGTLSLRTSALLLFGAEGAASVTDIREGLASFAMAEQAPGSLLRTGGVKIFADGIPPLHTAWLHEDYADVPGRGSLVIPGADDEDRVAELREMVRLAHAAGHQVGVHATGDAAIDAVVDAFAAAVAAHPRPDPRHYVIHGDLTYAATLQVMAAHGFGITTQPSIKTAAAHIADLFLGVERSAYQWPNRDALDAGVPLVFSSDAPVVEPDWRAGVVAAVTRVAAATGEVSGPAQRITVAEAIDAYTRGGAWQDFAEDEKGRLAVGFLADVCVLGGDPFAGDPAELTEMPILATVLDGTPVFTA